jgi:hypothetical protein
MEETASLRAIVEELIEVLHLQAKELERLVTHVEQATRHLAQPHQFSVVVSELSALQHRIRKLQ